ncbi:alpha/beta hydrolase fold domain-containing protein [Dactylosporangium sp. NPDC051485]|uniref:alpha/beta hydrolase n=1 Tax=Dactylosporangium sp. NPDC051485 TaxID=3154846 RepID=UPI00342BFC52
MPTHRSALTSCCSPTPSYAVAGAIAASGRPVVTVGYRLVPYPEPVDDVVDAFAAVRERATGGRVVLGGASAGACLAAAAALRLRDERRPGPERLVLAYGTFHAALPAASRALRGRLAGRWWWRQTWRRDVARMNRAYAGAALAEPHALPGGHDLAGLPPALLLDADRDRLRASGERFARELAGAAVPHEHHVVAGTPHGFLNRPAHPGFAAGIARIVAWLDATDHSSWM